MKQIPFGNDKQEVGLNDNALPVVAAHRRYELLPG
jgi:hypothetical protein